MIPLKEIVFEPGKDVRFGLFANSLVESPAIQENSVFFNKETKAFFSINEEQRIVFGPALIPDQLVYRNNGKEEYNLFATRDTIEKIAVDFAENNRMNNVNLDHQDSITPGVVIFQSLITNENTVPSVKGWEHLPVGTLFYGAKVKNDQVWRSVKEGKYKGWSIHGYFDQQKVNMSEDLESQLVKAIVEEIINTD